MSLEAFLHQLHFDPDKVKPPNWEADWDDAPLPYKLYRGLPTIQLSAEVPLTLEEGEPSADPNLRTIGHFLWYVFGLAQVSQSVYSTDSFTESITGSSSESRTDSNIDSSTATSTPSSIDSSTASYSDPIGEAGGLVQMTYRRFVPSGGGLYPNELYVYLKLEDLPAGIYHYDVVHHRLVLLREGDFDSYLGKALGNRCEMPACFGVAFVSTLFWKNFFKYNNFSYRLQGLDAGVLIGQLLEVAKRFGFATSVYFQFLDRAVNHLLGFTELEESVYAVIPLSAEPANRWLAREHEGDGMISAHELYRELPALRHNHYVRSQRIRPYPMLIQINEASLQDGTQLFRQIRSENEVNLEEAAFALPQINRLSYDLASVCRKRYSPEADYVLSEVSQTQLAALLQEATMSFAYPNDLDGAQERPLPRVALYGCFYGVEGIPDGAYRYDSASHMLRQVRPGDHRPWLQRGMSLDNINLFQVPLCFHVAGDSNNLQPKLGYRGYRIQQMEAGMLVQRLLLAAYALGFGGRPLLGFDVNASDEIYKLAPQATTSLIQIPVGPYRGRSRLEGSLGR